jgi:excisionase family DNA binding protein
VNVFLTLQKVVIDEGRHFAFSHLKGVCVMAQDDETASFQLLLTIPQVAKALNLGRTKIYELIWKEQLPIQKFGRAIRVSKEDLQHWLEERREKQ